MLNLYNLVILCSVATLILTMCEVESNSQRDIDIDSIVNLLRQQNDNYSRQKSSDTHDDGSAIQEFPETDDADNSNYGSLTSKQIMQLIQQATHETNQDEKHNKNTKAKLFDTSYRPLHQSRFNENNYQYKKINRPINFANEANLERLFSYNKVQKPPRQIEQFKERRYPNEVFKGHNKNKMRNEVLANLDDYSKVYVILNPLAIQKSKNTDSLNNLITKILSLHNPNEHGHEHTKENYKGFPVISDLLSRRLIRDSRESFGPKDSMEDNYKQKRLRNDHGGGGGSGGGRTAIPYIRQRGDIYERDN